MANRNGKNPFYYDVFVSFRGGTRYGFTDHLYNALRQRGIYTFRDSEELRIGAKIRPALLKAIENSRMAIVVLCEDYASSTWCLDELAEIVEGYKKGKKQVLAIFYKVEPRDVWEQRNSYADAMAQQELRFGHQSQQLHRWRQALRDVQSLPSQHCHTHWYEPGLIKKIIKDTSAKLPPIPLPIKHVIGIASRFQEVKPIIDIESHDTISILEIYGAGGIGKTTFALDIYNNIRHQFEAACFLANVREKSNKSSKGLEDLQKTLLSEMGEETKTMMGNTLYGANEIKRRLSQKKVLLVLDDVDTVKQLESLVGGGDWFGSGSRIIITSRDTTLLDKHVINDVIIQKYEMKELNDHDSLKLFCLHAFNDSKPAENFEDVSNLAVSYAKGLPLALKVIGSNLRGGSQEDWKMELEKYKNIPDAKIQEVLEISYHSLYNLDQKVFLDIACFFKGEKWEYVERILKACDFLPSIRVFIVKCLITIDENGCLDMHDLIQVMGREIVRKESSSNNIGDRTRLWSHEEVLQVLTENMGSDRIEGIMLDPPSHKEVRDRIDTAFEKMKNLRILIIRNTTFSIAPNYLPNTLRLLDWKGFPSKSFPQHFYPCRIVDFKLPHSSLILENPFQKFEDLTFINLSHCQLISQIPDLSGAVNLKVFEIDKCPKLVRFHKSIGFLHNLAYISALDCNMLKSFVPSMYLPSLEMLSFNFCRRLEHFPDVIQKMDKPLKIQLINTAIKELPTSISNLTGLQYIDISSCTKLENLPSSLLLLPKLVTLLIDGCPLIGESFKRFNKRLSLANGGPNLMTLHLSEARLSNEELYAVLRSFPRLEYLNASYNDFVYLPKCIKGSLHLKSIDVSHCKNLRTIPELPPSIEKVDARYCPLLTPEISNLLWSKVSEEKERIQFVMPGTNIPNWFDYVSNKDIPLIWARRKFPAFALAFVFKEDNETKRPFPPPEFGLPEAQLEESSYIVGLHLFIHGQEICRKEYHYCCVGEKHMLVCDLRVLFNEEEWKGLDAHVIGDEWRAIQVQYDSSLPLSHWGLSMYKKKTNIDDICFNIPHPNSLGDCIPFPSSTLVPKATPQRYKQKMRHFFENLNPREILGEYLPLFNESSGNDTFMKFILRSFRHAMADTKGKVSSSDYGASLKYDQEEFTWDVVQMIESIPKDTIDANDEDKKHAERLVAKVFQALLEFKKEQGDDKLELDMFIILEDVEGYRRYWGRLQIKYGEPTLIPVWKKVCQGSSSLMSDYIDSRIVQKIVLLKGEDGQEKEEGDEYDPIVDDLLIRIEEDAMRWNRTYKKLKASIVKASEEEVFSDKYLTEMGFLRGKENLEDRKWIWAIMELSLALLDMFWFGTFPKGLLGTKLKKMPYGKLRVDRKGRCAWNLLESSIQLIVSIVFFILKFVLSIFYLFGKPILCSLGVYFVHKIIGRFFGILVVLWLIFLVIKKL